MTEKHAKYETEKARPPAPGAVRCLKLEIAAAINSDLLFVDLADLAEWIAFDISESFDRFTAIGGNDLTTRGEIVITITDPVAAIAIGHTRAPDD